MTEANKNSPPDAELDEGDAWMTTAEVATQWGRNVETVRRWIRDGQLPAHRTPGGRTLLVKRSDVELTIARGRTGREELATRDALVTIAVPGDRISVVD